MGGDAGGLAGGGWGGGEVDMWLLVGGVLSDGVRMRMLKQMEY